MRIAALVGAILLVLVAFLQEEPPQTASQVAPENVAVSSVKTDEDIPMFDIRSVEVVGELEYEDRVVLQRYYDQLLGEGLFDRSMEELREFARQPEWIESAKIRRVWPHTLRIEVKERQPLALWNDGNVITADGVIIEPRVVPSLPLTQLRGPIDTEDAVLDQFILISQMLSTSSLRVAELVLEDRGAWNITFSNGVSVKLGRDQILDRLQRFVAVYKTDLSGRIDQIASVDARYPHGVAVKWDEKK